MHPLVEMVLSDAAVATVLAVLAAVVSQLSRRPALTHSLWLLVLLKLVTPPLMPVQLPWSLDSVTESPVAAPKEIVANREPSATAAEPNDLLVVGYWFAEEAAEFPEVAARPAEESATTPGSAPNVVSWSWVLLWLWPAGSLAWLLWTGWHAYRFHRLLRHAQPAVAELQKQSDELARKLGLAADPGVWLVPGVVSPMVWAIGRAPRLILPIKLVYCLDREQIAALLLHELAHVRRRDHWVRFLAIITTGAFWWHPVVWWARRELHEAEEQCCDAWVVWALPGAGRTYATALVDTLDYLSEARTAVPMLASGLGPVHDMKRRLTMIMRGTTPRSLTWTGCLGLAALGLVLLPTVPSWAQTEKQPKVEVQGSVLLLTDQDGQGKTIVLEDGEQAEQLEKARLDLKK